MKECIWVKPKLVANFEFLEWTDSNHVRHIKFVGLRSDRDPQTVFGGKDDARRTLPPLLRRLRYGDPRPLEAGCTRAGLFGCADTGRLVRISSYARQRRLRHQHWELATNAGIRLGAGLEWRPDWSGCDTIDPDAASARVEAKIAAFVGA